MVQRRTITCICPSPHAARLGRGLRRQELTVVAKIAADFPLGQRFAAVAAGALGRIPEAITPPTRDPTVEMVERANAPSTQRALQPHSLAHDAAARRNQWHDDGAAGDKLQIKRGRVQAHHPEPRKSKIKVK